MQCPQCESEDLNNLGGKRKYDNFDTRRYECGECGNRFMTLEKYHRPIRQHPDPPDVDRPGALRDVQE